MIMSENNDLRNQKTHYLKFRSGVNKENCRITEIKTTEIMDQKTSTSRESEWVSVNEIYKMIGKY